MALVSASTSGVGRTRINNSSYRRGSYRDSFSKPSAVLKGTASRSSKGNLGSFKIGLTRSEKSAQRSKHELMN